MVEIIENQLTSGVLRRTIVSSIGFFLVLGLILFVPAGMSWWNGWLVLISLLVFSIASSAFLWRKNPAIFIARGSIHAGTKSWDKLLLAPLFVSFLALFVVASLDARYAWSAPPLWLIWLGYLLFVLGFAGSIWVYAVNRFAEPSVRIQADRGHRVIDSGPYAIVRHPLYVFAGFLVVGMALALGSYRALFPVAFGAAIIIVRTALEDRTLQNELAGYPEYAARVRYRLIPGLW